MQQAKPTGGVEGKEHPVPAYTPEELEQRFAEAFNAGDVDGAVALYEPSAILMLQPGGEPVRGTEAIREALGGFFTMFGESPKIDFHSGKAFQAGEDLALVLFRWTLTGTGQDGAPLEMAGQSSDVVRQQSDGSWRFVIDNPFGAAALV
jgi:uncharacterized protein (TIGR02246 family)